MDRLRNTSGQCVILVYFVFGPLVLFSHSYGQCCGSGRYLTGSGSDRMRIRNTGYGSVSGFKY
jgi:hypothetical protein